MNFEVSLGCEPVSADVALVRPFPCVRPDVNLQGRVGAKDLAAVATPVLEKGLTLLFIGATGSKGAPRTHAPGSGLLFAAGEVRQVVGQKALAGVVQNSLGFLLQEFKAVYRGRFVVRSVMVHDDGRG